MNRSDLARHSNLLVVCSTIVLVPLIFFESTLAMADVWITNETFTHGFLIFPISLWLIWQKRDMLATLPATGEPRVWVLILPILAFWFVSRIVDVQVVQQLLLVSLIPMVIWLLLGRGILLALLFPILYLFFAVPLGQGLIGPMMEFTADFTVALVRMTGIPVYRDGLFFSLPSGNWSVVEECSGVRYLIASLALGTIYAYVTYRSYTRRLIFVLMAIIVPIIANGLRAFGIVMLGHHSGMTIAVGADHLLYGWVFFGVIIFAMFYIGNFWSDKPMGRKSEIEPGKNSGSRSGSHAIAPLQLVLPILVMSVTSGYSYFITHLQPNLPENIGFDLPDHYEGWQADSNLGLGWHPERTGPDVHKSRAYRYDNDIVQADVSVYLYQRKDAEAISSVNRLTDPYVGEWKVTYASDRQESELFVRETELRRSTQKILVWSWYRIGQMETPNRYIAKFLEAYHRVFTSRNDIAIITIATPLGEDKALARSRLREFWSIAGVETRAGIESLVKSLKQDTDAL